jgi:glutathione S-transferase
MKLYGHPGCGCTRRVLATLAEKGQRAELVLIDLATGKQKSADHLARHPFGVIPVLEDDGFELYESRAIMRYLDDKFAGPRLTPQGLHARARMEQWISVEHSYLSPACWPIMYQKLLLPLFGGQPDQDTVERSKCDISVVLDAMERALAQQTHLAADEFSLADLTCMPCVELLFTTGEQDIVEARPGVAAWWQRVAARPSWPAPFTDFASIELDCPLAAE